MPWLALIPAAIAATTATASAVSSGVKGSRAKKIERRLEGMQSPIYTPNKSILDYYDIAKQKYNTNITDTAEYKLQNQSIKQGTVQGLSSLNKLRSGNVSGLIQNQNNSLLKAAVVGEQDKKRQFNVLGQATGMKSAEESKAFNMNELAPFERKYNLLAMKAASLRKGQYQAQQNAYNNFNSAASQVSSFDWKTLGGK